MRGPLSKRLGITLIAIASVLSGCGGGGTSSMGTGGGTTTPDNGTLSSVDDSPQFKLKNVPSGLVLGVLGQAQTAGANLTQETDPGTPDSLWHFIPMTNSQFNIENLLTHQLIGISNASAAAGAQAVQWADNGTKDHLWAFYLLQDGNYLIKNVNSGMYLEVANSSTSVSAIIDQAARATTGTGCTCQEWTLTATSGAAYPDPMTVQIAYTVPDSVTIGIHDPSLLKTATGYALYSTHSIVHAHWSTDRTNFVDQGAGLPVLPPWTNAYTGSSGDLWAPDASLHNGVYWLYYAASTFGSTNSAIGLAVSSSGMPETFVDSGAPVYTSGNCAGSNAIDPASVVDAAGNAWLVFGSWSNGIQIVPVDNSTGVPTGVACLQLAYHATGTGIEGAYVYPHGGAYYLFASVDNCCNGTSSTYRIIVGRSSSVNGPYTDRGGVALTQGGGTILLSAHGDINGPGGESVLKDNDGDILVYHYYDGNNNGTPALGMNKLGWTLDGWPFAQ
jgi:arabinan endo-1,5-alpha-L-arabinosidase